MRNFLSRVRERPYLWLIGLIPLLLATLAACSQQEEAVEVTRVVTETVIVEPGDEAVVIEVTRVVTETVIENVEIEAESEEAEDAAAAEPEPPLATGSEDDSGPQPPEPENGPKVASRTDTTAIADVTQVTAVPLRTNPNDPNPPNPVAFTATLHSHELQKWCNQAETARKKRCH
ncbi:MAG: hypothetical protein IPJ90_06180 [Anaerolineaceae bacterium]|nr:hypothetical protein [Anaerolineaceae bacterium]